MEEVLAKLRCLVLGHNFELKDYVPRYFFINYEGSKDYIAVSFLYCPDCCTRKLKIHTPYEHQRKHKGILQAKSLWEDTGIITDYHKAKDKEEG